MAKEIIKDNLVSMLKGMENLLNIAHEDTAVPKSKNSIGNNDTRT